MCSSVAAVVVVVPVVVVTRAACVACRGASRVRRSDSPERERERKGERKKVRKRTRAREGRYTQRGVVGYDLTGARGATAIGGYVLYASFDDRILVRVQENLWTSIHGVNKDLSSGGGERLCASTIEGSHVFRPKHDFDKVTDDRCCDMFF